MPVIKLKHIVSFSSEDQAHPAENLLKPETYRKWKCENAGEKQASVIIELEKATQIHSVDIGNNGSAFVEVLVGRSSWDANESYQVLLGTSSFMSPLKSKTFTNTSRVRMFGSDKLSMQVAKQKWDRIKLVCTQPFNKSETFGLSFITLHSPPEPEMDNKVAKTDNSSTLLGPGKKRLGLFTVRDEDDSFAQQRHTSLLFKKERKPSPPLSTAAAVRLASSTLTATAVDTVQVKSRQPVAMNKSVDRRNSTEAKPYSSSTSTPQQVTKRTFDGSSKRKLECSSRNVLSEGREKTFKSPGSSGGTPPSPKRSKASTELTRKVSLDEIMNGVVFVLSGFQNPERAKIRDKALEMGAQYKPDWAGNCTHLICAFANTPKFNQVKAKGRGKIVSKKWITDCYKKEKKLPTRHYHVAGDSSSSSDEDSEEEKKKTTQPVGKANIQTKEKPTAFPETLAKAIESEARSSDQKKERVDEGKTVQENRECEFDEQLDKEQEDMVPSSPHTESTSDVDTEDELRRIKKDDEEDIYGGSTEDEDESYEKPRESPDIQEDSGSGELPELPDFFSHKHFFFYGELDSGVRRLLIRYITAYDGTIEDYMNDDVNFVVTNEDWDSNFDDALAENASLAFVRPKWIFACHEKEAMIPFQRYLIVPPS